MSNAVYTSKAAAFARKNDVLRRTFALDGVRCIALRREGQSSRFETLFEFITGHYIKFDNNRAESGLFRYATADIDAFRDIWAQTNAIAYGVPNDDGEIEVYAWASSPESGTEKDRIDPDARSVYFSGRMVRDAKERHTLTDASVFTGGTEYANGQYGLRGTFNSKQYFVKNGQTDTGGDGLYSISWRGSAWVISGNVDSLELYGSSEDVEFPWLVTAWDVISGESPAPLVEPYWS